MKTIREVYRIGAGPYSLLALLLLPLSLGAQPWMRIGSTTDHPSAHDPVMAYEDSTYYVFSTGMNVSVMSSRDLKIWEFRRPALKDTPKWAMERIPQYRGHTWAPDILKVGDTWHLYYSCSAFGKNTSVIGHATCSNLAEGDWHDTGLVVESRSDDNFNAIDPNVILSDDGTPYMVFGSFWSGMQLVRLTADMAHIDSTFERRVIARRERGQAIEAPFIYHHGGWYYLFVSWDYCCRGENSTYRVAVGRSRNIEGPYLDRDGKDMRHGGGTVVLYRTPTFIAAGHNSAYTIEGRDLFVCHGYPREEHRPSSLIITDIIWQDGWPTVNVE